MVIARRHYAGQPAESTRRGGVKTGTTCATAQMSVTAGTANVSRTLVRNGRNRAPQG
jgi:hypothetical protein